MISLILRVAAKYLQPLLLLFSIFLLLEGHNAPGGGFVGGLMAAASLVLQAIAYDVPSARRVLFVDPQSLIGAGLLAAALSGALALFEGRPFLTGLWEKWTLGALGEFSAGTPLLFDVGVYLTVVGVSLTVILTWMEE